MQPFRLVIEEDGPIDPDREALDQAIALLTPIRANRLAKRERQWRKEKKALAHAKKELEEKEAQCLEERKNHIQRRKTLNDDNKRCRLSRHSLSQWQLEDQEIVDHLKEIQRKIQALYDNLEQCQTQLKQAKTKLDISQLDNERLHAFKDALEE